MTFKLQGCFLLSFLWLCAMGALFKASVALGFAVTVGLSALLIFAFVKFFNSGNSAGYEQRVQPRPHHFSSSYVMARDKFRKAACLAGARLVSLELLAKTPKDEVLTIDIAWFGSQKPRRVLVHSCGLHGVEGFSGSAIQLQWLKEGFRHPENDDAVIIVHALNPYGMAWLRRFNENNVDLNRNFRYPGDFVRRHLPYWDIVDKFLNPASPPEKERFYLRAAWFLLRHWRPSLRQTVAGGQYFNPKGLFFGGTTLEEGPAKFQEWIQEHLACAERIVVIDIHTGLGRFAEDRLLVDPAPERHGVNRTMRAVFGKRLQPMDNSGVAYAVQGSQQNMYFRLFPRAKVFFAAQEFGTYRPLRVLRALRDENRWHFYGDRLIGRVRHPANKELLEVFNPKDPDWRLAVLDRGRELIHQACTLAFRGSDDQF